MRLLANENFPGPAVAALSEAGHDVVWIRKAAPGISDTEVLAWAVRDNRILVTFDKDFGELAARSSLPRSCGIVLFRLPMPPPTRVSARLSELLGMRSDWLGHFSVIEPGRIRMRSLR
jgi:predicted nuclease of predicted toxin-antitoxin system